MQNLPLQLLAKPGMLQESDESSQIPVVNYQAQDPIEQRKSSSNGLSSHLGILFFETDLRRVPSSPSARS